MSCIHEDKKYKYQVQKNGTKHWVEFCDSCGKRLSQPWCSAPGVEEQKNATEHIPVVKKKKQRRIEIDIFEDDL